MVRLAAVCIGFWFGKDLSRAVSKQMWANLRLKETYCIPKPSITRTLCLIMSLIPCFNSWQKISRREGDWADPGFDQFKSWTRGPSDFSCQALAEGLKENSTLKNLNLERNRIGPEAAKAWCLVWMVWRRGKRAAGFHRKDQDTATWNEVNEMLKGSESNA